MHEDRVQHAARIGIEPERNVADAENRLHLGQFVLDALHRLQSFDSSRAIIFLARRDGQSQGIEDQVDAAQTVFFRRQFVDPFGDRDFLIGRQRHAVFVNGQGNHGRAVTPRHGQHFRSSLFAIL